jgi:hypothetical protein
VKGPIGSGKSVACIQELIRLWNEQAPNDQGIRLSRTAIIRNTRSQLLDTTLKTFRQWLPDEICKVKENPSIVATVKYKLADGTTVQAEALFLALDQEKDTRKLLSLELSNVFINEAREVLYSVITAAKGRVGRYPSQADGYPPELCTKEICEVTNKPHYSACTRKAVIMDTNPPDDDHWWYQLDVMGYLEGTKEEFQTQEKKLTEEVFGFFNSPAPLIKNAHGEYKGNPKADNIAFLSGGYKYYYDLIAGQTEDYINVMVLGNYGMLRKGKPVYHEYNDMLHSGDIKAVEGIPIGLGWDFGLTPSVCIGQLMPSGQLRVLDELVGKNISARAFARDVVLPFLIKNYKGFEVQFSLGDPTGNNRGEGEGTSAINIINQEMGFMTEGAPTNDPTKRLDAVKTFLMKLVDGGRPGYMMSRTCTWLRKGKMGGYSYRRMNVSGERYADKPDKNEYSHIADAEQYLCLGYIYGYDSAKVNEHYDDPDLQGGY